MYWPGYMYIDLNHSFHYSNSLLSESLNKDTCKFKACGTRWLTCLYTWYVILNRMECVSLTKSINTLHASKVNVWIWLLKVQIAVLGQLKVILLAHLKSEVIFDLKLFTLNHSINFSQTLNKAPSGKGIPNLFKWRARLFVKWGEDEWEMELDA